MVHSTNTPLKQWHAYKDSTEIVCYVDRRRCEKKSNRTGKPEMISDPKMIKLEE